MYKGPVIDVDIHHQPRSAADLLPHIPARSRDLLERTIAAKQLVERGRWILINIGGAMRLDAVAPDGSPPGSNYDMLCEQLLDPSGVRRGMLRTT